MPKFVFAYHGGKMADTPEEGAKQMEEVESLVCRHGFRSC